MTSGRTTKHLLIGTQGVEVGPPGVLVGVRVGVRVTVGVNVGVMVGGFGVNVGVAVGALGVNVGVKVGGLGVNVGGKGGGVTPPPEAVVGGTGVTGTNVGELSVEINVGVAPVPVATVGFPPVVDVGVIPFGSAGVPPTFGNETATVGEVPPLPRIPPPASPPLFSTALNNSPTPANIPTTPNPIPSGINGIRRPVAVAIRSVLCC